MDNPAESAPDLNLNDRLNNWIAVSVALLAAFMAVTKVKDDNIVQDMTKSKAEEVDTWSHYQAKSVKQHIAELQRDQAKTLMAIAPQAAAQFEEQIKRCEAEIARYKTEEAELKEQAETLQKRYNDQNIHDDQFDLSDACLSMSLALLAVTALTRKKWLMGVALVFALYGVVMGLAGLCGWGIHPDRLMTLLS